MANAANLKGDKGEIEFATVLQERCWEIMRSRIGVHREDFFGVSPEGKSYTIEVKNHKNITLKKFIAQAKGQAAKRTRTGWLLACRLDGFPFTFLVMGSDVKPCTWIGSKATKS